ncbi:hypothetical protein [Nonomuraea sp. KM90]|uniref:hypothetical protein n=1 Tax=Nonomuraea sp. KM90 TaxID=3457428 RepID=UPI003FCEB7C5
MHPQHHEPAGGELTTEHLITTLQARARRATTAARWAARYRSKIEELRTELAAAIAERAVLHEEVVFWRRQAAQIVGLDPDDTPPRNYVEALRTAQLEPYRAVNVDIDGLPWIIGFRRHQGAKPDPLRELTAWQQLVAAVREARGGSTAAEA